MDNPVPYPEVMDALKRMLLQMQNKERMLNRPAEKTFAKNRAILFESVIHYLELRDAKRDLQRRDREEVPQGINLPVRGGKECPITGYR
jgi:hypothetical protein